MTLFRAANLLFVLSIATACSGTNFTASSGNAGGNCSGGCAGSPPGPGPGPAVNAPVCDSNALAPFIPVGSPMRVAAIPAGSYLYIGGDVYAETSNVNPQAKIHLTDDQPNNPSYPGNLRCITNLGNQLPQWDTVGHIPRNVQKTATHFTFPGWRAAAGSYSGSTLMTQIFTLSDFRSMTLADVEADQVRRESQGWSVAVYQVSGNEYKLVIIRPFSGSGVSGNLFIAARYLYSN